MKGSGVVVGGVTWVENLRLFQNLPLPPFALAIPDNLQMGKDGGWYHPISQIRKLKQDKGFV